jgi:SNF2 family DNA or RNA helicase
MVWDGGSKVKKLISVWGKVIEAPLNTFQISIMTKSYSFKSFIERAGVEYKAHQDRGVSWCVANENRAAPAHGVRGGFIADEMGLGKTIMMLGVIVCNFASYKRTLVVLPNVLVGQWLKEIERSCSHKALLYHGSKKNSITREMLEGAPIVLTTYSAIGVPLKGEGGCLLHAVAWDRVVFDEAHHLRNRNGRFYGAKKLESRSKWLISGTPVQNRRKDFFNLCSLLGFPVSFVVDDVNRDELFRDYVLRRTKAGVGIDFEPLTVMQKEVSWNTESEKNIAQQVHSAMENAAQFKLRFIMFARQACILPQMLREKSTETIDAPCESGSSKMDAVFRSLGENRGNGNGKLVFCHFHQEIDFILSKLREIGYDRVASFDGRLSAVQKNKVLDADLEVLVLQIQTGCEGLNLQKKYSEVYFVSPHWNPAVEEQAIARCHRIGQTKSVQVYKYFMDSFGEHDGTIEQYIFNKQREKTDLSDDTFYSRVQ